MTSLRNGLLLKPSSIEESQLGLYDDNDHRLLSPLLFSQSKIGSHAVGNAPTIQLEDMADVLHSIDNKTSSALIKENDAQKRLFIKVVHLTPGTGHDINRSIRF